MMVTWHHRLAGHESEQAPVDSEGQGDLVYCHPWGARDLATEQQQSAISCHSTSYKL